MILIIILGIFFASGNALNCFVCNSAFDENCAARNPPLSFLVECSDLTAQPFPILHPHQNVSENDKRAINYNNTSNFKTGSNNEDADGTGSTSRNFTSCRKMDVTIPEQDNGGHVKHETVRIVRSCGWREKPETDVCRVISREGIINTHCTCLQDACNQGHVFSIPNYFYVMISAMNAIIAMF